MKTDWYYQSMGEVVGPLSPTDLKKKALFGDIQRDTLVRQGADGKWVQAERIKGLFPGEVLTPVVSAPPVLPPPIENPESPAPLETEAVAKKTPADNPGSRKFLLPFLDLNFHKFVTPDIIRLQYRLLLAVLAIGVCVMSGVALLAGPNDKESTLMFSLRIAFVIGAALITAAWIILVARITLESVMVLFRICEHLEVQRETTSTLPAALDQEYGN